MLTVLLLLGSVICLGLAAFGVTVPRLNLVALGLALFVTVPLIAAWPG